MSGSPRGIPMKREKNDDDEDQTVCWISSAGHLWMTGYYDRLPLSVRRRLQTSPHNLCSACLVTEFLPKVRARHPDYSRENALLVTVEAMEKLVERRATKRPDEAFTWWSSLQKRLKLIGVTRSVHELKSAFGTKRRWRLHQSMSALGVHENAHSKMQVMPIPSWLLA